ncbi:hypothetical protein CHS0354_036317 [Potamilus streckersoni]|uniref:Peptidase C45 hydrolase domain-containing protein n=1 Tax=Potamilus streckersoni TaxID=2493646 RepID=A0AAE0T7V6_9BIVA|nr:hypothetical protein CHS0354_036317 [Potamilus streckersoni]
MAHSNDVQRIPMLYTRGTYYEVGHNIGTFFKEWIHKYFNSSLIPTRIIPFYNTHKGREIFDEYLKVSESSFPQYVTELRGMSDGSGMSFEHLFLLHISKEAYFVDLMGAEDNPEQHVHGCSSVYINTPDLKILAQNEDVDTFANPYYYIINAHIIDPGAPKGTVTCEEEHFTSLCCPELLPGYGFGFNKYGIVFAINSTTPMKPIVGCSPVGFITRGLLSAPSVDEMVRISRNKGYGASDGFHANIASLNHKEMWSLEVGPGKFESPLKLTTIPEQVDPNKPCHYFHFNEYYYLKEVEQNPNFPSSAAREKRVQEMSPPRTLKDVKAILGDTQNIIYPIYRSGQPPDTAMTGYTVFFDILKKTMKIYTENPKNNNLPLVKLPLTF